MAGNTSTPGASVVGRAVAVISAFDERHPRLTLSALAGRADLPISTTSRIAHELTAHGALRRLDSGEFVIGRLLWSAGLLAPVERQLREIASPFLQDLHAGTLATVHLAVRDDLEVLYLDRLSGNRSVPVVSTVGSRLPLHATGVGKVLLAHAPPSLQERVLESLARITPYTVTQPARLRQQLADVLTLGYATTSEEMTLGACSVAVPIWRGRDVVAALGIVVTSLKRDQPRLVAALQVAAHGASRSLTSR